MLRSALYYSLQIFKAVVAVHLTKINQNINKRGGGMLYVSSHQTTLCQCITYVNVGALGLRYYWRLVQCSVCAQNIVERKVFCFLFYKVRAKMWRFPDFPGEDILFVA